MFLLHAAITGWLVKIVVVGIMIIGLNDSHGSQTPCKPVRTFADGKTPSREFFVSPSGNNSTGLGSRTSPFRTVGRAVQEAQPGDAVRLLPGVHAGGISVSELEGTEAAPIWIGGEPGQPTPVLSGGATGIQLSQVRFLVLENLEVADAASNGINCDDGGEYSNSNATHHVVFRNLIIRNIGNGGNQDGLKLSGVYDYWVLDCQFSRISAGGSGIDHVGCHRGLISGCTFSEMGSNSIQCKGGSESIEIRGNQFINGGARAINIGGSTGFEFFRPPLSATGQNQEARKIQVFANIFRGSETPVAFVGAVESVVANNTIVEPGRWIMRILQETTSGNGYLFQPCGSNQFVNNLVYFSRQRVGTDVNIGADTDSASFRFSNNLWYAIDQPSRSRPNLPSPEQSGVYGLNPLLRDVASNDFFPSTNSPALGKGTVVDVVIADFFNNCFAAPPTIGAIEIAFTQPEFELTLPSVRKAGQLEFSFPTIPGRIYKVEAKTIGGIGEWLETWTTNGTGFQLEYRGNFGPVTGKYYRVKMD